VRDGRFKVEVWIMVITVRFWVKTMVGACVWKYSWDRPGHDVKLHPHFHCHW